MTEIKSKTWLVRMTTDEAHDLMHLIDFAVASCEKKKEEFVETREKFNKMIEGAVYVV